MNVPMIIPEGWIPFCLGCHHSRQYCYCDASHFGLMNDGSRVHMGQLITIAPKEILSDRNYENNNSTYLHFVAYLMLDLTNDPYWHYRPERYIWTEDKKTLVLQQ